MSRTERPRKRRYRVTNWAEYNAGLIARGSVTLWLDEAVIAAWHRVSGKGAVYSDAAILCALNLRAVFRLPLRQTQGLLASLAAALGLSLRIPDYSTLSRRAATVEVPPVRLPRPGPVHLAVDATGLKVYGEVEWKARQHGLERRRVWRKLHLGVDVATGEIRTHALTAGDVHDTRLLPRLIDRLDAPPARVFADGAYDSFRCHRAVLRAGADPVIPPRKGAAISPPPGMRDPPPTRGDAVRRIAEIGRDAWKKETGYHARSLAETGIYRYKTILGPRLHHRTMARQKTEAAIAVNILNRFTELAKPVSVPAN